MQEEAEPTRFRALKLGQACLACRSVKHKCDGAKPVCGPCTRRHTVCLYDEWKAGQTRFKAMQQKVIDLETQIKRLQSQSRVSSQLEGPSKSTGRDLQQTPSEPLFEPLLIHSSPRTATTPAAPQQRPPGLPRWPGVSEKWWELDPLPVPVRDHLIALWIPYSRRNGLDMHMPRFLEYLQSETRPVHPAVINAICLLGAHYSSFERTIQGGYSPDLTALEPILLQRTRTAIHHSLAFADRLYSFIVASYHLAIYFSLKGRYTEAQLEESTAARFAFSWGLNRLPPPPSSSDSPSSSGGSVEPSMDVIDIWDSVNLFWGLYLTDLAFFAAAGYPPGIPEDQIELPWPQTLEEFKAEYSNPNRKSRKTVVELFERDSNEAACKPGEFHSRIRMKVGSILLHTSRLGRTLGSNPDAAQGASFWSDYASTYRALAALRSTMPSYHCFEPPITIPPRFVLTQEPPGSDWLRAGISPRLIMVHTLIHTSAMQLHSLFAHIDRDEREECMRSANEIARIAAEVADLDPFMLPNTVALAWMGAFRIMNFEVARLKARGEDDLIFPLRAHVEQLRKLLEKWVPVWPLLGIQLDLSEP